MSCIITGSNSGIGYEMVKLFKNNFKVLAFVNSNDNLINQIENINVIKCNFSNPKNVENLKLNIPDLKLIINNAATAPNIDDQTSNYALDLNIFNINLFSPLSLIRKFQNTLILNQGFIINISSMAVDDPFSGFRVYASSKSALESLTRSINRETNLKALNIVLGAVNTKMLRSFASEEVIKNSLDPKYVSKQIQNIYNKVISSNNNFEDRIYLLEKIIENNEVNKNKNDNDLDNDKSTSKNQSNLENIITQQIQNKSIEICKKGSFSSAHSLFNKDLSISENKKIFGKCYGLHGHNYTIQLCLKGKINNNGFIIDAKEIQEKLNLIINNFDHKNINDLVDFIPTVENLASYFYDFFCCHFTNFKIKVILNETDKISACVSSENY